MSFEKILPLGGGCSSTWEGCSMSIIIVSGKPKLRINFSPDIMNILGVKIKDKLDCLKGTGPDQGKMLLKKGTSFSIGKGYKKNGRTEIPIFGNLPSVICSIVQPTYKINGSDLLITIPKFIPKKKVLS